MSTSVNTIVERYVLDDKYTGPVQRATAATSRLAAQARAARSAMHGGGGVNWGQNLGGPSLTSGLRTAAAAVAAAAGLAVAGGVKAMTEAADFEALKAGFVAIVGSAKDAEEQLKRLREIAKQPGINFEDAIKQSRALQEAGLSAGEAEATIKEFANAGALAGSSTEEMTSTILQLRQALRKGKIDGDELRSVLEGLPFAAQILKARFGSAVGADLAKQGVTAKVALAAIVAGLREIPRAADGAKNSFENVAAAMRMAVIDVGTGLNEALLPYVRELTKAADELSDAGVFRDLGQTLAAALAPNAEASGDWATDALLELGGASVTAAAALRNLSMNVQDATGAYGQFLQWVQKWFGWIPAVAAIKEAGKALGIGGGDANGAGITPMDEGENWKRTARMMIEKSRREREKAGEPTGPGLSVVSEAPSLPPAMAQLTRAIERNTEANDRLGEINRMIFGGGNLGRFGVSPVELGQNRRGNVTININGGEDAHDAIMRLKRLGALG